MTQFYQGQNNNKKPLNTNIIISICFIIFIIVALLIVFAVSGQDVDPVSGVPTAIVQTNPTAIPAATPNPFVSGKKVIIDPGHGGSDVGTIGSGNYANEDALNLAIALKVGNYLSELGITPIYTRSNSNAVAETKDADMQERVNIINASSADLAVSIHMNSYPENPSISGPEVYYYGYYGENAFSQESATIAAHIQSVLNDACNTDRISKPEDFMVLRDTTIPAVLIECGFLSNAAEEAQLNNEAYQDMLAQAIANGIYQSLLYA